MRIAVTGGNGQLGSDICRLAETAGHEVLACTHEMLDVTDLDSVALALIPFAPDVVINTAAFHHVEKCEERPELAFAVNGIGARNVARLSSDKGLYLIHVSTDYVFDGEARSPRTETDLARPLNVYGNTKLSGEYFVRVEAPDALVMRVSGLYGRHPCRAKGLNFVDLMLKLADERDEVRVVDDEVLTPTSTMEVARQVLAVLDARPAGLCHATAQGSCSWYTFAREIFDRAGCDVKLSAAAPGEFPAKVPRPMYSVLENAMLKRAGLDVLQSWQEGLREYLETLS